MVAPAYRSTYTRRAFTAGGIEQGYLVVIDSMTGATTVDVADGVANVIVAQVRVLQPQ